MKLFQMREVREAIEHAMAGGQAVHLHTLTNGHPLFTRYGEIAHLFDQNRERLIRTAQQLGVRVIKLERSGEPGQHVDLCGHPLERARIYCGEAQTVQVSNQLELAALLMEPAPPRLH